MLIILLALVIKISQARLGYVIPNLMVITIFYFYTHYENLFSTYLILLYSFIEDLYQDLPFGSMAISYILIKIFVETHKRYLLDKGFSAYMVGIFIVYSAFICIREILFLMVFDFQQIMIHKLILEILFIMCYYPLLHIILNRTMKEFFK